VKRHGAFDPGNADFAVSLRRVTVAGGEQPARHKNRQVELRPDGQVPCVDVAGALRWREDRERPRLIGRDAHRAAERHDRDVHVRAQLSRRPVTEVEVPDVRVGEV